jgi:hypothetical protein
MVGQHFGRDSFLVDGRIQQREAGQGQNVTAPFQQNGLGRAAPQIHGHHLAPFLSCQTVKE